MRVDGDQVRLSGEAGRSGVALAEVAGVWRWGGARPWSEAEVTTGPVKRSP